MHVDGEDTLEDPPRSLRFLFWDLLLHRAGHRVECLVSWGALVADRMVDVRPMLLGLQVHCTALHCTALPCQIYDTWAEVASSSGL